MWRSHLSTVKEAQRLLPHASFFLLQAASPKP